MVGALIAKHRTQLVNSVQGLTRTKTFALFFYALFLYTYLRTLGNFIIGEVWLGDMAELLMGIGASLLIILLLALPTAQRVMEWEPLVFLGRISDSLYLLHAVVLLSLVHALAGRVDIYLHFTVTIPLSIFVSWVSYV